MQDNSNKQVLLVEDEEPMLQALTEAFSNEGFTVYKAKNGEDGLITAFQEHPDIIILDILMPKLDGMGMMKKLREDIWGKHVPVILLSNVNPEGNDILQGIVVYQPAYYLIKADMTLEGVIAKAKSVLNIS